MKQLVLLMTWLMPWLLPPLATAQTVLEAGFHHLYNLRFREAQALFREYQAANSADPLGFASEAAGLAFQEFHRLGLLRSENFLGTSPALDRARPPYDQNLGQRFYAALAKANSLAEGRLHKDAADQDALFAQCLAAGLSADYAYLVERRSLAALHYTRQAESYGRRLLSLNAAYYDAYLPLGASSYILASLPATQRLVIRLGGITGDKQRGARQLELTAQKGHLLKPFAKVLLALIYVRENQPEPARRLLLELQAEFPSNTIFPTELATLERQHRGSHD